MEKPQFRTLIRAQWTKIAVLAMVLTGTLGLSMATPRGVAAAGCLESAHTMRNVLLVNNEWETWQTAWTTNNCADLNLLIDIPADWGCTVLVHAMYWSPSQGQWIKSAAGTPYITVQPGSWSTPMTRLKDPTYIAWRYKLSCSSGFGGYFVTTKAAY